MALEPGIQLAHYEVTEMLGKGGMGEVYRARDTKLGREVAIKVLPSEFSQDAERLARLEREARMLASLNHPNIAAIHGLEESDSTRFLVLELVEGDTLADRLKRDAIPVEESLNLALQIAEALEAAHEKGVIHRDLKPANIKVTPDGKVKVLDFGLAKAFIGEQADVNLSNSPTLSMQATQAGMILGTAAYMSPEQASGEVADHRADVWAFGVVLFEMLTGRQMFTGKTASHVMGAVLNIEPTWDTLPVNLHPRVRVLLERLLEKEAKDRLSGISDARVEIQKVLADPGGVVVQPVAEVVQAAPQSKLPWVTSAVLALGVVVLVFLNLQPEQPDAVRRFDYELPEGVNFANAGRQVVAISPDGGSFVYRGTGGFYLRTMDQLEARLITGIGNSLVDPVFSPDGQQIAYMEFDGSPSLMKISVSGGAPIVLTDPVANSFGISWEEDGTILYGQPDGIWQVSENGGTPVQLVATEEGETAFRPQLLPGGEWVLFTVTSATGNTRWDEADVVIESLASQERRILIPGGSDARYVPTGHLTYALGDVLFALPFDVDTLELSGGPVSILQGVRRAAGAGTNTGAAFYSFSDDGTLVYVPGIGTPDEEGGFTLATVDRQGSIESLSDEYRAYWRPRVSPDGSRIAVEVTEDDTTHIWLLSVATGIGTQFTFEGSLNQMPLWTADSQTVVFRTDRLGDRPNAIFRKSADLSTAAELIIERDSDVVPTDLSSDGVLVFHDVEGEGGAGDIWTVDIDTPESAEVFLATPGDETAARFSPDGLWLAYSSTEAGERRIYVRPYPRTEAGPRQVADEAMAAPVWSPDGSELYTIVVTQPFPIRAAPIQTAGGFEIGRPEDLFTVVGSGLVGSPDSNFTAIYDVLPSGDQFVWVSNPEVAVAEESDVNVPQIIVVQNWFEELKERVPVN